MSKSLSAKLALLLLGFILLVALSASGWTYYVLNTPQSHNKANEYISIPKGTPTQEVVNLLYEAGIIKSPWPLLAYLKLRGLGPGLKAGDYRFPSPITPLQTISKLREGQQKSVKLTIIEGWTRWDIAQALTRVPELGLRDSAQALALMNNTGKIKDLDPQAENLEGYLYPDTYFLPVETTPQEIINLLVNRTRRELDSDKVNLARQQNLTPRQLLTIASLIETEAKLSAERPLVASVIFNRLKRGIPLGIDSTVIYAAKIAGKWKNDGKVYQSDLARISPYNTRLVQGLPPGPIASPSAASIDAVLHPAQTSYLYYVRNPDRNDGAHNFYDNDADFARGVQALRAWEQAHKE